MQEIEDNFKELQASIERSGKIFIFILSAAKLIQ